MKRNDSFIVNEKKYNKCDNEVVDYEVCVNVLHYFWFDQYI